MALPESDNIVNTTRLSSTLNRLWDKTKTKFATKADDDDVVHKAGEEIITGRKISQGSLALSQYDSGETGYNVMPLGGLSTTNNQYSNWAEEQKDGHHYREWEIVLPYSTLSGDIRVTLTTDTGTLQRIIKCDFCSISRTNILIGFLSSASSGSGTTYSPNGNRGYYTIADPQLSSDFRISDVLWDSSLSEDYKWVIKIRSMNPERNLSIASVMLELIGNAIHFEDAYVLSNDPSIVTGETYDVVRGGSLTASDTSSNIVETVYWLDVPKIQNSLGKDILVDGDIVQSATNGNLSVLGTDVEVYSHPTQTAYTSKGTATKVPQITTDATGHVTSISEVTISGVTPSSHASTATTYGIGTTSNYGHVKLATGDMNGASNTDGVAVSKNHTHSQYAPKASPALTGTPTAPTAADGTNTTQIATTAFVQSAVTQGLAVSDAMVYKGTVTLGASSPGGLTVAADKGHTYKVIANGTTTSGYVDGVKVEAGDMVICNTDSTAAATSSNYSTIAAKWDFVQGNTDGVVVGPASATSGNVVLFDGATGKLVKDGGTLGTAAFKNVDTTPTDNSTNAVTSGGVKTALDGKVSSIKKNGSTITPSSGVADIGYMPVTEAQASATVQEVIQSLRVKPGGRMGSVLLYASTISSTSIPAAWYNYIWIPHRTGAAADDNQNFGTLILTPMTNTPDVYVIEGSNLNTSSAAYRIKRLGNDASFLYANLAWGGAFRTSLSPFDNYAFKSANCFFGAKPSAIRVEYSTDGGTTWLDYGLTDAYKQMLLSQYGGVSVFCGKNTHIQPGYTGSIVGTKDLSDANIADQRLRITICDSSLANEGTTGSTDRWLYCTLRRIGIYMSTQSATAGVHCLFERRTSANFKSGTDTWVSEGDYKIQGDSGWNSIPCSNATTAHGITFGMSDSHTREIRFTIWSDKLAATPAASQTGNLCIYRIVAYSENLWTNNSSNPNVANYGSPYTINPETGVTQFSKGITSGVAIPISSGGTGKTSVTSGNYLVGNGTGALTEKTPNAVGNNVLTSLATGDDNLIEGDYIIASNHTSGATDTTKFVRRTTARLWNYIRSQISSVLGLTATTYGGNAATATAAQSGSALETAINAKQNALTINDSKPITIGTAAAANTVTGQAHTHDGITSIARASVTNIDVTNSGTEPARMTLSQVTTATVQGTDPGDGYVLNLLWDNAGNWDTQIYVPNSKKADKDYGHLKMRYKNESSTWGEWEYLPGAFKGTLLTSNDDLDTLYQGLPGEVLQYYWNYTNKAYSTVGKTQSGMDATTGLPTGTGTANLFVFHQSTSRTASGYVMQLMFCADIGIYYRRQFNGTWNTWTKILLATDITTDTTNKNGKITVDGTDKTVYVHPAGSAASKTGVPTANATPAFGGTFKVNQITTDATSHVSAVTERTITIPNTTGNASTAGLTKLYTATGTNTDGTMTQNAIKSALDAKMSSTVSEDASNELQVVGVQSSATSTLKRDSGVTVQGGAVKATTYKLGTNATITYNSTTEAIDFTFL